MKRLLFLPLLALPLLVLSCEQTPTEPAVPDDGATDAQMAVIQSAPATGMVKAKLRCSHGVTGWMRVQMHRPSEDVATSPNTIVNCGETVKITLWETHEGTRSWVRFHDIQRFGAGDYDCPSPTTYFQETIPSKNQCPAAKPAWAVSTVRYTKH